MSNENIEQFDEDTGIVTEEYKIDQAISSFNKVITQANHFLSLKEHEGWKQIERFIANEVEDMLHKLRFEPDLERIRRLQSQIVAFESVLNIIDLSLSDAEKAKEELSKLTGPE